MHNNKMTKGLALLMCLCLMGGLLLNVDMVVHAADEQVELFDLDVQNQKDEEDFLLNEDETQETEDGFVVYDKKYNSPRNSTNTWRKVIDVSHWQTPSESDHINWQAVKNSGVYGVFVKVGGRDGDDGTLYTDSRYAENLAGASAAGLKVGAYFYSEAISTQEAVEEANYLIQRVMAYNISLPLVIDYEYCSGGCRLKAFGGDVGQRTAVVNAFCRRVEECGYTGCVYASASKLAGDGRVLDGDQIAQNYKVWVAQYPAVNKVQKYNDYCFDMTYYSGTYDFWQFSSRGTNIAGIPSTYVDLDWWYDDGTISRKDYSAVFDASYYASRYPDVVQVIGNEPASLLNHFISYGMKEMRQGNANFDPYAYMISNSNYDLRKAFRSDWRAYYEHYMSNGRYEGRTTQFSIPAGTQPMFRLYNPNNGEHLYTADWGELKHLSEVGWNQEGIAWYAPMSGTPVYRLFNPNGGEHHYTLDVSESNYLASIGWNFEGIAWYSGGGVPVHRLYNPNGGQHHYTLDVSESNYLASIGWNYEGIGWYAPQ